MKHLIIILLSLSFLLPPFITGCGKLSSRSQGECDNSILPAVVAVPATRREIATSQQRIGQIVPDDQVELVARVEGYLVKRYFEEGSKVKKGDLIFLIEQDQYKAELESAQGNVAMAQATLQDAKIEFNRYSTLVKDNAVAQKELDNATMKRGNAEGELLVAQGKLSLAKLNLSYTEIRAPFDGKLGVCPVYEGNLVGAKTINLASLVEIDPVKVEFPIPESVYVDHLITYGNVKNAGESIVVRLLLPNGKEYPHGGVIYFADNRINNMTGTIFLRARFPNPEGMLVPGGYVKVILGQKQMTSQVLILMESIQRDQAGTFVLVVSNDGAVERRNIVLGADIGGASVVGAGLSDGELVITQGALKVRAGVKPKVTQEAFPDLGFLHNAEPSHAPADDKARQDLKPANSGAQGEK